MLTATIFFLNQINSYIHCSRTSNKDITINLIITLIRYGSTVFLNSNKY